MTSKKCFTIVLGAGLRNVKGINDNVETERNTKRFCFEYFT